MSDNTLFRCTGGVDSSDATATSSDILSGKTAYVNNEKIEGTIPSKSAATITPSTSNQIISSGQYLTGNQIIKGDSNLISSNIKSGVSIFGVNGSLDSNTSILENFSIIFEPTTKGIYHITYGSNSNYTLYNESTFSSTFYCTDIALGDGIFVFVGRDSTNKNPIYYTNDLFTFKQVNLNDDSITSFTSIAYGNGKFIACSSSCLYSSSDGITWTKITTTNFNNFDIGSHKISFTGGKFFFLYSSGYESGIYSYTSTDGITWTKCIGSSNNNQGIYFRTVAYGNGKFIACRSLSLYTSTDGITWTTISTTAFNSMSGYSLDSIAFGNNKFCIVSSNYTACFFSTDDSCEQWTRKQLDLNFGILKAKNKIVYNKNRFIIAVSGYDSTDLYIVSLYDNSTSWTGYLNFDCNSKDAFYSAPAIF